MSKKFLLILTVSFFSCAGLVSAQNDMPTRRSSQFQSSQIYYEAHAVPKDGSTQAVIFFRIPHDRLVFVRNRDVANGNEFFAKARVAVELFRDRTRAGEKSETFTQYAVDFEATRDRSLDLTGTIALDVEPGRYSYRLVLDDSNREDEASSMARILEVPDFSTFSTVNPIILNDVSAEHVFPLNLGGNAAYARPGSAGLLFSVPDGHSGEVTAISYTVYQLPSTRSNQRQEREERTRRARREVDEAPARTDLPRRVEEFRMPDDSEMVAEGVLQQSAFKRVMLDSLVEGKGWTIQTGSGSLFYATIDLGAEKLPNGAYVLRCSVTVDGETKSSQTRFSTHWRDMPMSLLDLDFAIAQLEFIVDRGTVRAVKKGSFEEKQEAFLAFWKERDPSPETEYNELMTEFYRRVDHAAINFSSGGVPDGLKSDKARIYILNGPPDETERALPESGGVQEIWRYDSGAMYVFQAASSLDSFYLVK